MHIFNFIDDSLFNFQLPRALFEPILYSAMVFWIAGLFGGFAAFVQFCVPVIACAVAATAWGK